jgi:3',5'-cyclic AMP phosphodiesterase CpdA
LGLSIPTLARRKLFSFVHASDPHVSTWGDTYLDEFVAEVNAYANNVDFVILTGDIGAILADLTIPYYPTPGNHDRSSSAFSAVFGPANYIVDHKGYRFMNLNSLGSGGWEHTTVNGTTLVFIDSVLAETDPSTPIIAACHHSWGKEFYYCIANEAEIKAKFANHNFIAHFSGHSHENEYSLEGGVRYFNTEGITRNDDDEYRLVNVFDDTITADLYRIGYPPTEFIQNDPPADIETGDQNPNFSVSVTPNPFISTVSIIVREKIKKKRGMLRIYDISGKLVHKKTFLISPSSFFSISWNPNTLPSGIYVLQAATGNQSVSKQLILTR